MFLCCSECVDSAWVENHDGADIDSDSSDLFDTVDRFQVCKLVQPLGEMRLYSGVCVFSSVELSDQEVFTLDLGDIRWLELAVWLSQTTQCIGHGFGFSRIVRRCRLWFCDCFTFCCRCCAHVPSIHFVARLELHGRALLV